MIQFACLCGARHEQESFVTPACWMCGDPMFPSASFEDARPIGEIVQPIADEILTRALVKG